MSKISESSFWCSLPGLKSVSLLPAQASPRCNRQLRLKTPEREHCVIQVLLLTSLTPYQLTALLPGQTGSRGEKQ